jgi:predicted nucleic acid-binding protein
MSVALHSPGPPAVVAPLFTELIRHPRHQFWPDSRSLVDHSGVDASRLLEASQLTDTDLLALAAARGGRLASLDRRLSCAGVAGGREALWLIEG